MSVAPLLVLLVSVSAVPQGEDAGQINPVPRAVKREKIVQWDFAAGFEGWIAENQCRVEGVGGSLRVTSTGSDPFFHRTLDLPGGRVAMTIRARGATGGMGRVFWTTDRAGRSEARAANFSLRHNGKWHETSVSFVVEGRLKDLRIDPGSAKGQFDIDWIRLSSEQLHPLTIENVSRRDGAVRFMVKNHRAAPLTFTALDKKHTLAGGATVAIDRPLAAKRPLERVSIELTTPGYPPVRRTVFVHNAKG